MFERYRWSNSDFRQAVRPMVSDASSCRHAFLAVLAVSAALLMPIRAGLAQTPLTPVWGISTIAGNGTNANTGEGGPAVSAKIGKPYAVAMDKAGNLYIAEEALNVVRKINANGIISTVVGTSSMTGGYSGDGGPATSALLNGPTGVGFDVNGNLLIADEGNERIRKVDVTTGVISTIAGTGTAGYGGNGGVATSATLSNPYSVCSDRSGNIYIADAGNHVVRKINSSGVISTFAGNNTSGNTGNGGAATSAELVDPYGVWTDATGNLYIADYGPSVVRMVDTSGNIHAVAGNGTACSTAALPCGDRGAATSAALDVPRMAVGDNSGDLYIADEDNHAIRWVDTSGNIHTIAGMLLKSATGAVGDGGPATLGEFDFTYGISIDSSNNLYVADASNYRVRRLSLNTGLPSTAVGTSVARNLFLESSGAVTPNSAVATPAAPSEFTVGVLANCSLGTPLAANTPCTVPITFEPSAPGLQTAQLAFTDASGYVSTIGLSGIGTAPEATFSLAAISTIAGNGMAGNAGAGGPASSAEVSDPRGGVIDSAGNIYFADSGNNVIRRIDAVSGSISNVAGTGMAGYTGDGAAATSAQLRAPAKVVLDAANDLYIADTGNNVLRFVDASTGVISTVAGNGTAAYSGDGGSATAASLNQPQGLVVDQGGHVYVADTGNNAIRYFGNGGVIATLAGNGTAGYAGDGGNVNASQLNAPQAVALDQSGNIYIADTGNDVVREISATNQISTIAGQQGQAANTGDGGAATAAELNQPSDIAQDAAGDFYIAAGGQVRMINTSGIISTLAGTGAQGSYSGEGGVATAALLPSPVGNLMLDSAGDVFLSDTGANLLLRVAAAAPMSLNFGVQAPGTTGTPATFSVLNTGNSMLNFSAVAVSANFTLGTTEPSACTATTSLAPGQTCSLSIAFSPSASANGAVSGTLTLTDNALNAASATQTFTLSGSTHVVANTTTTIGTSPPAPVYGAPGTITATIDNGNSPTGTVSFTVNGTALGAVSVSNDQASIALPVQPAGTVVVAASYSGDSNNDASSSTAKVVIQPAVLTVTTVNATMNEGTSVPTLTYTVTGFVNGDPSSVVTGAPAETTTATSASSEGTYPIGIMLGTLAAANYSFTFVNGTLTVGPPPTADFQLSVTPTQATNPAGVPYVATLTMIPLYGYTGAAKITCSSAPQGLGCSAASLAGGGGPLTGNGQGNPVWTQISIGAAVTSSSSGRAANRTPSNPQQLWLATGIPLFFFGLAFCGGPKGKWPGRLLRLILLAIVTAGASSCSNSVGPTAAIGTYQVTITATDTAPNLSHSTLITLTLQ